MSLAAAPARLTPNSYTDHVNPQWVRLLNVLEMNVRYTRCSGAHLVTDDGRSIVDFLSGYCVHNAGHNHPEIVAALQQELDSSGPAMLQSHVSDLAGELAVMLCERAGGRLRKAFFCSSGSEGVEAAIKFSRAHTGRDGIIYASGAFHGLTCGALSLADVPFWRDGFGPLLPDTHAVPFGDLAELDSKLATRKIAAFIVEPIQAEAGIRIPPPGYLHNVRALCTKYGSMLILDEVQTGMYRTGPFLASEASSADPDMVVLAKALSGGLVPSGVLLLTDDVYRSVYDSLKRAIVHTSTFSENSLAMRAGIATIQVLEQERLGPRAIEMGEYLRQRLRAALAGHEMVKEIRGAGLLNGIEFQRPASLKLRLPFEAFHQIHPGMFGQVIVMRLFRDAGFLTQICGNHFMVLKAAPPLMIDERDIDQFTHSLATLVDQIHSSAGFWTEALGMARRVINI